MFIFLFFKKQSIFVYIDQIHHIYIVSSISALIFIILPLYFCGFLNHSCDELLVHLFLVFFIF